MRRPAASAKVRIGDAEPIAANDPTSPAKLGAALAAAGYPEARMIPGS